MSAPQDTSARKIEWDTDGLHWSAPDISFVDLAENYHELISTANAMCVLLWQEYALTDDTKLTEDARQLKQRMLRDFEVIECKSLVDCSMSRDDFDLKYRLGHT